MLATSASCTPATCTPASPSRICSALFSGRRRSCARAPRQQNRANPNPDMVENLAQRSDVT
jgi:hypothetical protein